MAHTDDPNVKILSEFQTILTEREKLDSKIATREQETASVKNQEILEVASTYTIDDIVKGLADLQLSFSDSVNGLTTGLSTEVYKLHEFEQAIRIETQQLKNLQQIRIVADALHLLTQTHQEQMRSLDRDAAEQNEILDQDIARKRQLWQQEQVEFEQEKQQKIESITQERQRKEADYQYELDRQRTIEADEYEQRRRTQSQELQVTQQNQERDWIEREQFLADYQSLLEEYRERVEVIPAELDEAVHQARLATRTAIQQEAEVQVQLLEKEWEATQQGYDFQLQSLETTIQTQLEQIETLNNQLQETLQQSHLLTMRAFGHSPE